MSDNLSKDKLLKYLYERRNLIKFAIQDIPCGIYGDTEEEKNLSKIIFTNKISVIDEIIDFVEKDLINVRNIITRWDRCFTICLSLSLLWL